MSCTDQISAQLTTRPERPVIGAGVYAVLYEVAQALALFVESGQRGAIDLRSLPLTGNDHEALAEALGRGEVEARLEALGETRVVETACHGVWWITHRNPRGDIVAESIEITDIPQILASPADDVRDDLTRLQQRLEEFVQGDTETREA